MSYDGSLNISSPSHRHSLSLPINGVLDLVFEPDSEEERIVM